MASANGEEFHIYNSFYRSLDKKSKKTVCQQMGPDHKTVITQKPEGANDSGLVAIALVTSIAYDQNPFQRTYEQALMRKYYATQHPLQSDKS